jgi:flagellar basal body-associated protein FliL
MPEANPEASAKPAGKNKKNLLMAAILFGVMTLEGGGIFVAMKLFGSDPAPVVGAQVSETQQAAATEREVLLARLRPSNMRTGKLFLWDMEVYGVVEQSRMEKVKNLLENREATIHDRLARLVRSADPRQLEEPGLETLRRQIKHEMEQIFGQEGLFKEVLIPKCTPFRADY